jgi:hypothetical protein
MDLVFGYLSNANISNQSVSFAIRPHRYEQDFYIDQFKMTAVNLVFWLSGQRKHIKPKSYLSPFARTATYRISILAKLQTWQATSVANPERASSSVRLHCYVKDCYIGHSGITR